MEKIRNMTFDEFKRYISIIFGLLIIAISFNLFFLPYDLVVYDANGLAVIVNEFISISPSIFIFLFQIVCLIIGIIFLGIKEVKDAIIAAIIYPIFVELTKNISILVPVEEVDMIVVALFAGITTGIGNGLVFKSNFNTGGTDLIELILCKYFKISFSKSVLLIDGAIVVAGAFVFGIELFIYALFVLILIALISDRILIGISTKKIFYIISKQKEEIKKYLTEALDKSITELEGKGFHTGYDEDVLVCVTKTSDYYKVKQGIQEIDPAAFIVVIDTHEVLGSDRV